MKHLFVRELCGLLHELHVTQDAIAAHLHVARSSVAGWTGGQRPVPHRHAAAFLAFARSKVQAAFETAWQENVDPPGPRTFLSQGSAKQFEAQVNLQLRRWEMEIYATTGRLDAEYAHYASLLKPYLHLPPSKLSHEERQQVQLAHNRMNRALRAFAHLENRPEDTEGRLLDAPFDLPPPEYFDRLVAWWQTMQTDEERDDQERNGNTQEGYTDAPTQRHHMPNYLWREVDRRRPGKT